MRDSFIVGAVPTSYALIVAYWKLKAQITTKIPKEFLTYQLPVTTTKATGNARLAMAMRCHYSD